MKTKNDYLKELICDGETTIFLHNEIGYDVYEFLKANNYIKYEMVELYRGHFNVIALENVYYIVRLCKGEFHNIIEISVKKRNDDMTPNNNYETLRKEILIPNEFEAFIKSKLLAKSLQADYYINGVKQQSTN